VLDHRSPGSVGAVVPVAVGAAVEQQDVRGARPERSQRVEERLAQELRGAAAFPVQQDEKPTPVPARPDEDLVQVTVREPAVQREPDELRPACRVVPGAAAAAGDRENGDG
jgi:hypothetical protein